MVGSGGGALAAGGGSFPAAAGGWGCGTASASVKSRPSRMRAPRREKKFGVTPAPVTCSGSPSSPETACRPVTTAASPSSIVACSRRSWKSPGGKAKSVTLRLRMSPQISTRRSWSW
jgi:hypothetical protein